MSILKLVKLDNNDNHILLKKSDIVDLNDIESMQTLFDDMIETCIQYNALGLAAPQIGINKRIFVIRDGNVFVNPKVIARIGKMNSFEEGCLSVGSDKRFNIKRAKSIIIDYFDRNGQLQRLKTKDKLHAIVIQHEIDHLNGKLICHYGGGGVNW